MWRDMGIKFVEGDGSKGCEGRWGLKKEEGDGVKVVEGDGSKGCGGRSG